MYALQSYECINDVCEFFGCFCGFSFIGLALRITVDVLILCPKSFIFNPHSLEIFGVTAEVGVIPFRIFAVLVFDVLGGMAIMEVFIHFIRFFQLTKSIRILVYQFVRNISKTVTVGRCATDEECTDDDVYEVSVIVKKKSVKW